MDRLVLPLYPYQVEGAKWLSTRKVGLLADEMGIGKSAQAISACEQVGAKSILVICRAVATQQWRIEFSKFSKTKFELTITSYESLHKIDSKKFFDVVIVDESHYVKEPGAARTKAVLGKTGAVHRAGRSFLLTGTPTPNHAGELWTTLYTFGRTKLSYDGFVEKYCRTRVTSYGRQILGSTVEPDKIAELRDMLGPICLRRTKEEVNLNLPPITYGEVVVKPGKVDLLMSQSFRRWVIPVDHTPDLEKILETELGVMHGIVKNGFTRQAMSALEGAAKSIMTLRRYTSLQKIEPVIDLLSEELDSGAYRKIVIFAIHRDTIISLQERLSKKYGAVLVFGGSKPTRVTDRIAAFQNPNSKCRVFIAQIHAAGTSLTLTAADQVLFIDQDFVPGNNAQAAARCHRIGQTRPVTVRFVSLANSIDQHISAMLKRKTEEIRVLANGAIGRTPKKPVQTENKDLNDLL